MTDPIDDENYPPKPRWIGWAIVLLMLAITLGVLNIGWRIWMTPSPGAQAMQNVLQERPELAAAKQLVEQSDCMRCHGWDRKYVGPSFFSIAEKYRDQADAQTYLAGKIREGSVGVWGNVIMPRHPQISQEQSLQMADWMLAAAPAAATTQTAPQAQ